MRAEDQDAVAGVEQGLGEILLERLGPRGDDDVLGPDVEAELGVDRPRRGGAELGQAQARAVAGLVRLDRRDPGGLGGRGGRERAVADLQLDDVLPLRLQGPGQRQDGEGGLGRQAAASRLSRGIGRDLPDRRIDPRCRDRGSAIATTIARASGSDDPGDDLVPDDLLADRGSGAGTTSRNERSGPLPQYWRIVK